MVNGEKFPVETGDVVPVPPKAIYNYWPTNNSTLKCVLFMELLDISKLPKNRRIYVFVVRRMTRKDLDVAISWAAKEGWNPGLHDAEAFYAVDPRGYFMGFLDDKPVASLSAVSYPGRFGFLGFYIVKSEHRGKGYGWAVWQEAMKYLQSHNVGLDGVVAQQENYKNQALLAHTQIFAMREWVKMSRKNPNIFFL